MKPVSSPLRNTLHCEATTSPRANAASIASCAGKLGPVSIPSVPMSYGEARHLLEALGGPLVPKGWQGGLPFTYHVGPGGTRVHMRIEQDYAVRPIWNVIATMPGREHPEQTVILGNHRDAWTYGGIDPNSGTIAINATIRGSTR